MPEDPVRKDAWQGKLGAGGSDRVVSREQYRATRHLRAHDCDIRLSLPARAENVAVVRHVVSALAESLALPPRLIEDIKLAVTEACTNVVRHAYVDGEGPIDVAIVPDDQRLTVIVADKGQGIQAQPPSEGPGLGLPLIAALAHEVQIDHGPDRGSRLEMCFHADSGSLETA